MDELLFGGTMGWNAGQPRGWRDGTCSLCSNPTACQQRGYCAMQGGIGLSQSQSYRNVQAASTSAARRNYDLDLPPDAVREVRPMLALAAPLIEGDSDGGECD
ncbi:hypothetical protein [Burkholderia cepacia]|uniref:hypothetical protein n=1 Tax=Burkholderia cepacia TaxID=292 RepID=UPI00398F497A